MKAKLSPEAPLPVCWRGSHVHKGPRLFRLVVLSGWSGGTGFGTVEGLVFVVTGKYDCCLVEEEMAVGPWKCRAGVPIKDLSCVKCHSCPSGQKCGMSHYLGLHMLLPTQHWDSVSQKEEGSRMGIEPAPSHVCHRAHFPSRGSRLYCDFRLFGANLWLSLCPMEFQEAQRCWWSWPPTSTSVAFASSSSTTWTLS